MPNCRKHTKVKLICPACIGERSNAAGPSKSFLKSARRNLKLAHAARRKYSRCPRYASHHFSPTTGRCPCGFQRPASGKVAA
jgi:hypothetical protein